MSSYSASVRVEDGTLHTSRPLTAPDAVTDMIDSVIYTVQHDGAAAGLLAVELTFETAGESETPIGDAVAGTSSTPLPVPVEDDEPGSVPGELPAPLS